MDYISMSSSEGSLQKIDYVKMNKKESPDISRVPLIMDTEASPARVDSSGYQEADDKGAPLASQITKKKRPPRVFTKQKEVSTSDQENLPDARQEKRYRGASLTNPCLKMTVHNPDSNASLVNGQAGHGSQGDPDRLCGQNVDYQNDPSAYLTPTESPPYSGSFFRFSADGVTSGSSDNSNLRGRAPNNSYNRLDSGVDCATERGSSSTTVSMQPSDSPGSTPYPRLSIHQEQHYEDIDTYSRNRGVPSTGLSRVSVDKTTSNGTCLRNKAARPLPEVNDNEDFLHTSIAETVSCHLTDPTLNFNPRLATLPHTYAPLNITDVPHTTSVKKRRKRNLRSTIFVAPIIILFILSISALVISLYLLISSNNEEFSMEDLPQNMQSVQKMLDNLKKQISKLEKENEKLQKQMEDKSIQFSLIAPLQSQVQNLHLNLTSALQDMKDEVSSNFSGIRLLSGPQGPPGVVNFSLCLNQNISKTAPAHPTLNTETEYLPSLDETKKYFVTFAYCTYSGALDAMLNYNGLSGQYRCRCHGMAQNSNSRTTCTVNIWMCPL